MSRGPTIHLTPPDQAARKLVEHAESTPSWEQSRSGGTPSWPSPTKKPTGWKRGGKEKMEDILEGMGLVDTLPGGGIDEVTRKLGRVLVGENNSDAGVDAGCDDLLALLE